jgi:hypothetical protein
MQATLAPRPFSPEQANSQNVHTTPEQSPHQLAHVVVRTAPPLVQARLSLGSTRDRYEQEADRVADQVVRSTQAPRVTPIPAPVISHGSPATIQRKAELIPGTAYYYDPDTKKFYQKIGGWGANPLLNEVTPPPEIAAKVGVTLNSGPVPTTHGPAPITSTPTTTKGGPTVADTKATTTVSSGKTDIDPDTLWEQSWRAKQVEVLAAMQQFVPRITALDSAAQVRIRGSLAKGIKGPQKIDKDGGRLRFDPEDFDIDAYVVSNKLYQQAITKGAVVRSGAKGVIVGSQSNIGAIKQIVKEARDVLAKISGNRDTGPDAFHFNIYIRTVANANNTTAKDQADAEDAGLEASRGNPLVVPAPKPKGA